MPNWYGKLKGKGGEKARWSFSVEAQVMVPPQANMEEERETADKVLRTVLNRVEGDASMYTAIDSNVSFDIQFEPLRL